MQPIRVLLVEDDEHTRAGLAEAVEADDRLQLLAAAAGYAEAEACLSRLTPDILLVDLGLPDGDGTELIRKACTAESGIQAMVITVFGDERHVIRAIEAGATGYLVKDADMDQVATAIHQLAEGQSPISPAIARHLLKRFQAAPEPAADTGEANLTDRENEVLDLVAKGYSYTDIGSSLTISVHTARTHIRHIYRKLSVRTRGQAVYEAMQMGLINRE